jgi:ATP diphosphatase
MAADQDPGGPRLDAPPAPPTSTPGAELERLVEILQRLRSPGGCPWDREQTLATLSPFVLEEAHEVVDAIDRGDIETLRDEIGDLIFEGAFLAQLCAEDGSFTVADSLRHVNEKLIRRHPHVFASTSGPAAGAVTSAGQVVEQWESIKARERAGTGKDDHGALGGLARSLPALLAAHEMGSRAAAVGFDWQSTADVLTKIEEEVAELRQALASEPPARAAEEMGDLLLAIANLSRKLGIEPESALRGANRRFTERFRALEREVARSGRRTQDVTLDELEAIWQGVKATSGVPQSG